MANNIELNGMVEYSRVLFQQLHCDKHEYIEVEMTTSPQINKPTKWLQCKFCGKVLEIPDSKYILQQSFLK